MWIVFPSLTNWRSYRVSSFKNNDFFTYADPYHLTIWNLRIPMTKDFSFVRRPEIIYLLLLFFFPPRYDSDPTICRNSTMTVDLKISMSLKFTKFVTRLSRRIDAHRESVSITTIIRDWSVWQRGRLDYRWDTTKEFSSLREGSFFS